MQSRSQGFEGPRFPRSEDHYQVHQDRRVYMPLRITFFPRISQEWRIGKYPSLLFDHFC